MVDDDLIMQWAGFEWDEGNLLKNWEKHGVSAGECEQVFFNRPLIAGSDEKHSEQEARLFALGHTDSGRLLFVVFTTRSNRIRIISARDMSRRPESIIRPTFIRLCYIYTQHPCPANRSRSANPSRFESSLASTPT
ncbi:MAG: BrnT family toxin [Deltaproteobacteria bacterium]|nr:BrnT family toxin [Deltaproteobacteria bacterium]